MCRYGVLPLAASPQAARDVRRWAFDTLSEWGLAASEDALLLASELVTSAAAGTRSPLKVALALSRGLLEVDVRDHDPRMPAPRTGEGGAAPVVSGRALLVVEALANEWGVAKRADGTTVWARLLVAGTEPDPAGCPCRDPDDGQVPLASGRRVTDLRR